MGDLAEAERVWDDLGEIACLTFVRGVDEGEALLRLGAYPDTVREKNPDEILELLQEFEGDTPQVAIALGLGSWSVVVEPGGFCGADHLLLSAASVGTEAIAVLRHDYASAEFAYAVDGTLITGFEPSYPSPASMHGVDSQRLWPAMRTVGFRHPDEDGEERMQRTTAMALLLAQQITGVAVPLGVLDQRRLCAELEPWFAVAYDPGDLLSPDQFTLDPHTAPLVAAVEAATPATQRRVAIAEVRRQAERARPGRRARPGGCTERRGHRRQLTHRSRLPTRTAGPRLADHGPDGLRTRARTTPARVRARLVHHRPARRTEPRPPRGCSRRSQATHFRDPRTRRPRPPSEDDRGAKGLNPTRSSPEQPRLARRPHSRQEPRGSYGPVNLNESHP